MNNVRITAIMGACFLLMFAAACTNTGGEEQETAPEDEASNETSPETTENEQEIRLPEMALIKKDEGKEVTDLQHALEAIGYPVQISGVYDEMTTWAITDFQLQHDGLTPLGVYNEQTKEALNVALSEGFSGEAGKGLPQPTETAASDGGTPVLSNPYDQLALVNKQQALPSDYVPGDMVVPDVRFPFEEDLPKKKMREPAAEALKNLFEAAEEDGLELFAQSGYRSYDRQDSLFASYVEANGEEAANKFSARPGESEHQTGLTMDITSASVDFELTTDFGETEEGKWVKEHAAEYGFIIRYPEGKEQITGYQYEPWHLRYVGEKTAKGIRNQEITLEEYLNEE
ncbi:D-alanyl-D-alanine carboxypeptidase family protein [Virgibacillus xinjiangensis]|uniref:D-alanyl-D-alanine carboxypeptidase family protein n=1 Tax=Virgibacillus xinjiangensis TaxID=393090 RepID=A0ABV7CZ41_9BACI